MARPSGREKCILLLMDAEVAEDFITNKIFTVMRTFPEVEYAVVLLEDNDDLRGVLRNFQLQAAIFDAELDFYQGSHKYSSYELLQRVINKCPWVQGMMFTARELGVENGNSVGQRDKGNENIVWVEKLKMAKKDQPGLIAVQNLLQLAFGS